MKTSEFLCAKAVSSDLKSTTKPDVIAELVDLLINAGSIDKKHRKKILEVLMAREALGSTAIGRVLPFLMVSVIVSRSWLVV